MRCPVHFDHQQLERARRDAAAHRREAAPSGTQVDTCPHSVDQVDLSPWEVDEDVELRVACTDADVCRVLCCLDVVHSALDGEAWVYELKRACTNCLDGGADSELRLGDVGCVVECEDAACRTGALNVERLLAQNEGERACGEHAGSEADGDGAALHGGEGGVGTQGADGDLGGRDGDVCLVDERVAQSVPPCPLVVVCHKRINHRTLRRRPRNRAPCKRKRQRLPSCPQIRLRDGNTPKQRARHLQVPRAPHTEVVHPGRASHAH